MKQNFVTAAVVLCINFRFKLPMINTLNPVGGTELCKANNIKTSQTLQYAVTQRYINSITRNPCYRFSIKNDSLFMQIIRFPLVLWKSKFS